MLRRGGLTVVDFWSETCIPCKQLTRVLEQLAGEVPESVVIGKVNSEQNPALMERYNVRSASIPCCLKDGAVVKPAPACGQVLEIIGRSTGVTPEETIDAEDAMSSDQSLALHGVKHVFGNLGHHRAPDAGFHAFHGC